jgi:hypothetical protein
MWVPRLRAGVAVSPLCDLKPLGDRDDCLLDGITFVPLSVHRLQLCGMLRQHLRTTHSEFAFYSLYIVGRQSVPDSGSSLEIIGTRSHIGRSIDARSQRPRLALPGSLRTYSRVYAPDYQITRTIKAV